MFQRNINREFRVLANLPSLRYRNWIVANLSSLSLRRMSLATLVQQNHVHHNGDVPKLYPRQRISEPLFELRPPARAN